MSMSILRLLPKKPAPAQQSSSSEEEARYRPISWDLLRKMFGFLKPHKKSYIVGISLGLVHVSLDMLGPFMVGWIVSTLAAFIKAELDSRSVASLLQTLGIDGYATTVFRDTLRSENVSRAVWKIVLIIGLWAAINLVSVLLQRALILMMTRAGESVQFEIRRQMFSKLQMMSMSFFDKMKLGRIISRMTSDINSLREVNVWGIWQIIANVMIMVIAAGTLLWTDWRLFLSVSWLGVVLFWVNNYFRIKSGSSWQQVREGFTRVSTNLAENITGVRVVTAFNRQTPNLGKFNALQVDNTANNMDAARLTGAYQTALQSISFTGKAIILCFGGYLVASGRFHMETAAAVGVVVTAFLYWDWFMLPIQAFGNFYNQMLMAMAGAERVFNLLEMQPEVTDKPGAKDLPVLRGDVEFQNVSFSYVKDRQVLKDVSFTAKAGQTIALVGATGSGKSSIINLVARFYLPQAGTVLVDGLDVSDYTGHSLHTQMGMVLQVNFLFSGSVMENICYAKPKSSNADVYEAAKRLGTYDAIMSLKDGFDTDVGERGANMSLGQRQLICFTRAFLADPRIFMLDEATSAIDTHTEMLLQESLEKLTQGRTTFIVAHRLSTIMKADVILVIDAGEIIERGTHDELVAAGGKYAGMYTQFSAHV